jgi:hypothetical protein
VPHSGQNFGEPSAWVPQLPHVRFGLKAVPHSGTELAALRFRAALPAHRGGRLGEIPLLRVVDVPRLLEHLVARRLRLRRRDLLVEIGRARLAQARLRVPADRLAHPLAAPRALLEGRRDLFHRRVEGRVVLRAGRHRLQLIGGLRGAAEEAAQQSTPTASIAAPAMPRLLVWNDDM